MEFRKEALSFEAQADRLIRRGLQADRETLIHRLTSVSYYRLSGYLYPFREKSSDNFIADTHLDLIWQRYCFDRRLRVLLLDVIERIEVAVRTQLVYQFSHAYGPFGYCDENNLPKLSIGDYINWRDNLHAETARSKEAFKKHFFQKYGAHRNLPVWMVSELMSMGSLLTFYKGVDDTIARKVAGHFGGGMADELLLSWLRSLYALRNICAHHGRLLNRVLGYAPALPQKNKFPEWHLEDEEGKRLLNNERVGILLMICQYFIRQISPTSQWASRIESLFDEYPEVSAARLVGLPENWKQQALWQPEDAKT
jgi:abortive infection bacteriophage resistance protein